MEEQKSEFPVNSIRICVEEKDMHEFSGFLCGVVMEQEEIFQNVTELLVKLNNVLDRAGTPQAFQQIRTFGKGDQKHSPFCAMPRRYHESEQIRKRHGKILTVDAVISTRQHVSWQGVVKDISGNMIGRFYSDLDLIKILVNIMEQ